MSSKATLRTYASFLYQAGSWKRPRKVVARLEMLAAAGRVTCMASDRMSCQSATANQVRLVLHTAAFWLIHGVRAAIPRTNPVASADFATIRERLIKIGARVIEHIARIRVQAADQLPEAALFRTVALGLMPAAHEPRGRVPRGAADMADQLPTRCKASRLTPVQLDRSPRSARRPHVHKTPASVESRRGAVA